MKVQAIVVIAGFGTRLESEEPKPIIRIGGEPIFVHSLKVLEESLLIDNTILVTQEVLIGQFNDIIKKAGFKKISKVVSGGVRWSRW